MSLDVIRVVMDTIVTIAAIVGAGWGAWITFQTKRWDAMTKETRDDAKASREVSEGNRMLIQENTMVTRSLEKKSDGVNERLRELVTKATASEGAMRKRLEDAGNPGEELDELDTILHEKKQAVKDVDCR